MGVLYNTMIREVIQKHESNPNDNLETFLKENFDIIQSQYNLPGSLMILNFKEIFKQLKVIPSDSFFDELKLKDEEYGFEELED